MFVSAHFPDCNSALLAGSAARGEATATSDLDIVVIDNHSEHYRKSFRFEEWPVEVFVHTEDSLSFFFQIEQEQGIPLLIRLCAEGVILRGERIAKSIINDAKEYLRDGPSPWSEKKRQAARYIMTYLLEDLEGSDDFNEDVFTVHSLIEQILVFYLRTHHQWSGEGKWIYRELANANEKFAKQLTHTIAHFHETRQKKELIELTDQIMDPYGGRFFEGFTG